MKENHGWGVQPVASHSWDIQPCMGQAKTTDGPSTSGSQNVVMSILGLIIVDTWLAFDGCTRTMNDGQYGRKEKQSKLYELLAKELIDNSFNQVRTRAGRADGPNNDDPDQLLLSPIHVTPTKRRRHNKATGWIGNSACFPR